MPGQPVQPFGGLGGMNQPLMKSAYVALSTALVPTPSDVVVSYLSGAKGGRDTVENHEMSKEPYRPEINSRNPQIQKMLDDPEFRQYVETMIQNRYS